MNTARAAMAAALLVLLTGCAGTTDTTASTPVPGASGTVYATSPGRCHARQVGAGHSDWEPDPSCTPGSQNPRVTQQNLQSTICVSGWSGKERSQYAPESLTESLKKQGMTDYGFNGSISGYEEDHLWSIENGGSPNDPHNLWPEPGASPNDKDNFENYVHTVLCANEATRSRMERDGRWPQGGMTLAEAGHELTSDWYGYWVKAGKPMCDRPFACKWS